MDQLDSLFSKDGWVITKNASGKTKVASCNSNETNPFDKTRSAWITLNDSTQLTEDQQNDKTKSGKMFKSPFKQVKSISHENRIGFYLIRDLLNFEKLNSLTETFLADNIPITKVIVCARITSYEQRNNFYRLILDDGTSSILCVVKIKDDNACFQNTYEEDEILEDMKAPYYRAEEANKNSSVAWAIKKLTFQTKKFSEDSSLNFSEMSLGRPVRIIGYLREFCGKTFIFCYNFRWISEKYFVNFLNYIIQDYEYKQNYMLE